jgi:hypothetical protein
LNQQESEAQQDYYFTGTSLLDREHIYAYSKQNTVLGE